MKRKSQLLALLMALCLLASLCTLPAAAEGEENDGNKTEVPTDPDPKPDPTPEPEPEPTPDPKPDPTPNPDPDPDPDPDPEPDPEPTPDPDPNPTPNPDPNPTPNPDPNPTPNPDPDPKPTPDPTPEQPPVTPEKPPVVTPTAPDRPGASDLTFSVSSLDFGTLEKGTNSGLTKTFQITNRNSKYTMYLSFTSISGFTVSGVPNSLAPGASATVTVSINSTKTTGDFSRTLQITGYYEENGLKSTSRSFSLSIYAKVAEWGYSISVSPTSKDFGKLKEGYTEKDAKEKEITVTIKNTGSDYVRMDGVKGNDHFTVTAVKSESERVESGKEVDYKIVPKQGVKAGTYTDKIVFQTREGATAEFKATLVVEKSVAPLTVSPSTLEFGFAEEGYTQPNHQTVTVKNNSDKTVTLEQPVSPFYEFSLVTSTSLSAGGSTTFTVRPKAGLPANSYTGIFTLRAGGNSASLDVRFVVTQKVGPTSFSDVAANSTFAADIAYVSQQGLMSGVGGGQFKPQSPVTRGQIVTILYRLAGQPAVSGAGFSDVAAGSYCEKAVKWAAATGITNGNKDGTFSPNNPITREQLAAFLYRYANHKGLSTAARAELSRFPDAASVSSYATEALAWANGASLVNGTGEGRLNPSGGATRGQAAAILHRFCTSIGR